jgi:hypothetical protein
VLAIEPKDRRFKHGQGRQIFNGDNIRIMISFGGKVKPFVSCRKILRPVNDPYSMKEIIRSQNSRTFMAKLFLLRHKVSAGYCQTAVVGESGIIRTQMGKHNRSVMVAVFGTPREIPPRKQ